VKDTELVLFSITGTLDDADHPALVRVVACRPWVFASAQTFQIPGELPRLPDVVITGERLPRLDEAASRFLITPKTSSCSRLPGSVTSSV
jgi:hypothetical protein